MRIFFEFLSVAFTTPEAPIICLSWEPGLLCTGVYLLERAFCRCTTLHRELLFIGFILMRLASTISSVIVIY